MSNTWEPVMGVIDYSHERLCKNVYFASHFPTSNGWVKLNAVPWHANALPAAPSNQIDTWWWR